MFAKEGKEENVEEVKSYNIPLFFLNKLIISSFFNFFSWFKDNSLCTVADCSSESSSCKRDTKFTKR